MNRRDSAKFAIIIASVSILGAQSGPGVASAGYRVPSRIEVAPGQIVTLFVTNMKVKQSGVATGLPLPTTLAGISVSMTYNDPGPVPVPILVVVPVIDSGCAPADEVPLNVTNPCGVVAVTIQVPYFRVIGGVTGPNPLQLIVSENGVPGPRLAFRLYYDQIHIVTGCFSFEPSVMIQNCKPVIAHANFVPITARNPAQPGETVVLFAYGLGATLPAVVAGVAAPTPAAVASFRPSLSFLFSPNATAGWWSNGPVDTAIADEEHQAQFAGLAPGCPGLYQINFKVPTPPSGTPSCDQNPNLVSGYAGTTNVVTNVTVVLRGSDSWDGAGFCVAVPTPSKQPEKEPARRH